MMMCPSDLRSIARALNGEVVSGQVSCPGPGHSPKDRSLSLKLSASAPMGFIAFSHCGDSFADCRDYVAEKLGLDRNGWKSEHPEAKPAPQPPKDDGKADFNHRIAASIVRALKPIAASPDAMRYLEVERKINIAAITDVLERTDAIGWHPECLFREPGRTLDGKRLGAIVGIMTDPLTAKPTDGITRTYLDSRGHKIGKANGLGPAGLVRLTPDEDVTHGLFLAEGLETALAAMSIGLRPTWSAGSTSIMSKFPVLSGIQSITILGDNDENGAGERAAREAGQRWKEAGRVVRVWISPARGDFNDLLMGGSP